METDASYLHHQYQPMKREEEGFHPCPRTQVETKGAQQLDHCPSGWGQWTSRTQTSRVHDTVGSQHLALAQLIRNAQGRKRSERLILVHLVDSNMSATWDGTPIMDLT